MSTQWWEHETSDGRYRQTGKLDDIDYRPGKYRALVALAQHDGDDYPHISMWMWSGRTPAITLTVEDARTLGYALLDAAQLVDTERDNALRRLTGDL